MLASGGGHALPKHLSSSSYSLHNGGSGLGDYGTAVLRFFFRRVARSGPRLLVYLAALLTSLLVVTTILSHGLSDSLSSRTSHLWQFRPSFFDRYGKQLRRPPPGQANGHDAVVGGGLRIVVFGENDVATSQLQNIPINATALGDNNSTSWTEVLCLELGCTTYLSYVPALDLPRRSLSSNELYEELTKTVLELSASELPANDFSYVARAYPVPSSAPDLHAQVEAFLARPPPLRPPKETVFIFSFGPWDIWSLAAFPFGPAEEVVRSLVSDLFDNIERLYDAAHVASSVAYSDHAATPQNDAEAAASMKRAAAPAVLPWDITTSTPFRVMVPLVLDPSVLPGWRLERPGMPVLHTKPEHARRAVRLTKLWNDQVEGEMSAWMGKFANQTAAPSDQRRTNSPDTSGPRLRRDGTVFPMPDYIMDAVIDGQLHARRLSDRRGFGKLPKSETFVEVDKPCLAALATSTPRPYTVEMQPKPGKKGKGSKTVATASAEAAASAEKGDDDLPAEGEQQQQKKTLHLCENPDQHLFFTPFSLGQRGIEELGRLGASLLRADRNLRAAWRNERTEVGADREPASWKEYYVA